MLEIAKCSNVESEEPTFDVVVVVVKATLDVLCFQYWLHTFTSYLDNLC